ncbi:MAG TPA: hypothetical protein VGW36_00595 [Pyrinomonadaceae bacterium]|nr:hypothetical protein [Pyrinomonadaceae bacterium]
MKTLKASMLILLCIGGSVLFAQNRRSAPTPKSAQTKAAQVDPQTGHTIICKGIQVPEGFVIGGEIFSDSCQGSAWIIKRKGDAPIAIERLGESSSSQDVAVSPVKRKMPAECDGFRQVIKQTYDFKPQLLNDSGRKAKSAELDDVWNHVKRNRSLLPCLRKALEEDKTDSFFNVDGANLLVELDPSRASKEMQVRKFASANLDGVDLQYWVRTLARRGVEGFDVSEAGAAWLSYPKASYTVMEHGNFPVGPFVGAVCIFGSMDEDKATPVLQRIASQPGHPNREDAVLILMSQATPASFRAMKEVNTAGMSAKLRKVLLETLEHPKLLQPRNPPHLTRQENLRAFQGIIDGDRSAFRALVLKAPDGEVDAVATLKPEDIPLVRRTRRAAISRCNQHAMSEYGSFTQILWALNWKPELARQ